MTEKPTKKTTNRNYRNSPVIGDGGVTASPADISTMTQYAREVFESPKIDLDDPEVVKQTIIDYFKRCEQLGIRPGNLEMYASIGLTKQDVSNAILGYSKKLSPATIDIIKKGKLALSTFRESLAMSGKLHPATSIFWAKNFDGMEDKHEVDIAPRYELRQERTAEEIEESLRKVELDIPVDDFDEENS